MSSPPARGSSRSACPWTCTGGVVPARAGIFPPRARRATVTGSRPRPRGDLPQTDKDRAAELRSSPPARGSSRSSPSPGIPGGRRPRPRGDLPPWGASPRSEPSSSPPARGSSADVVVNVRTSTVVPARAGIFRDRPAGRNYRVRRPRPRGDLPAVQLPPGVLAASSPPARGSSSMSADCGPASRVVPARAGIFPLEERLFISPYRRPRPRGDLPRPRIARRPVRSSSPPARGSSPRHLCRWRACLVVPARAGIFLVCVGYAGRTSRRPRPRGDLPAQTRRRSTRDLSSPPARGSSPSSAGTAGHPPVVPARAGIFPRSPRGGTASPRRPRPRGDLPATPPAAGRDRASSPPARGSSSAGQAAG